MTLADCPKCEGTARSSSESDCRNCGGQTMAGRASGKTTINPKTGLGCLHEFEGHNAGRCYVRYVCKHCSYTYSIDSGD